MKNVSDLRRELFREPVISYVSLLTVCAFAFILLVTEIRNGLPYNHDPDEPIYWLWALLIRNTGSASSAQGGGYPPGFLLLLIMEQVIVEAFRGSTIQNADYFLVARYVNITFATATVFLAGWSVRRVTSSLLAGILAALALSLNPVFISESRRAAANAPWMFSTLLCLWLALVAVSSQNHKILYASFVAGLVSILFKYQSVPILLFPLWQTIRYFWQNKRQLTAHFAAMGVIGLFTLLWLVLGYHATEIVNTPATGTRAIIDRQSIFELVSFWDNFRLIYNGLGKSSFLYTTLIGLLAMLGLSLWKKIVVDWHSVILLLAFYIAFHLLMSFFYVVALSKWLPVLASLLFLWSMGVVSITRLVVEIVGVILRKSSWYLNIIATIAVLAVTALPYLQPKFEDWQNSVLVLRKTHTYAALGNWFIAHVPEGARTVAEVITPFNYYSGFPGRKVYHSYTVDSIFQDTVHAYRERGYEYLIWTSQKSVATDSLTDLETPERRAYLSGAQELLRLTGDSYRGPDIVVFQLPPIQQHVLYAWFTPAISFRGYDLNSETFKAGDTLELMLYWMSAERTTANYIVFVHLLFDDRKTLLAGQDGPPDYGNRPTWKWEGDMQFIRDQRILTIPADAPPGKYILRMGMYDADTQLRAQITSPQGQPLGDTLTLQEIEIEK